MILTDRREQRRFIKFTIVGTLGAAIDFSTFNLLIQGFGVPPVSANVVSFSVAVTSNFIWNRYWTYPDSRSKHIGRQLGQFFLVNLIGVLIRTVIFASLEPTFIRLLAPVSQRLPFPAGFLGHNLLLGCAMLVVLFWNFFVNRHWTYSDVRPAAT